MISAEDCQLRAELLVSGWCRENRMYLGQGAGVDWQARKALIRDVAAALGAIAVDLEADDAVSVAQLRRRRARGVDLES